MNDDQERKQAAGDADPKSSPATADDVAADDPHKAEKLSKLGHGDDAPEGSE